MVKMTKEKLKRLKGSGVLVVILTSIAFTIYVMSTYSEQEHFGILQNKYEKDIIKQYEQHVDHVDEFYEQTLKNQKNV